MGWRSERRCSQDLRDRVLSAVDGGMAVRQAAATFGVSPSCIYKALMRRRPTGDGGPSPNRGHAPRKLKALLRQDPARTVDALVERIGCTIDCFPPGRMRKRLPRSRISTLNVKML